MEECESLDTEMMELQDFQSEANSQDDEDEVEELQNSLREVVQDQSVKPKLQCLMVDPSFSMVTVQSEDSGIVWETASSRCSTPWASETSSTSEAYSMEGSGAAGKITIVFDEEKVVRRRTRSGGRSSRLGDRLSRPGSSRSASALGVERPEMSEVSLPNVKPEKTPTEPDLEDIRNKDQQLFSLISEGYEILNIRVPSKLPTVDEEESTELQDNLSYLDQTPKIKSKNNHIWRQQQDDDMLQDEADLNNQEPSEQDSSQQAADTELSKTPTPKDSTGDIDYFEKFTLLDVGVPGDLAPQLEEEEAEKPEGTPQEEEQKPAKETATDSPTASEDSFVFVTDVEIVGEHLDEVFYGEGAPPGSLQRRDKAEGRGGKRMRRESQRSLKESGSVLFGSQETILTPIFISPGPPKIIDPILLEEPTAMSFMYSDLYEDALGERRTSDEEYSEAESVASEKSYKRRLSDSEETDGYLEKFTLKDETPAAEVEVEPETVEDEGDGRMMWPQNKFEMTGCLTRVIQEEGEDESETKEPKTLESSAEEKSEDLKPEATEEKVEKGEERAEEKEEIKLTEEEPVSEASQELALDEMKVQEVKQEGSTDEPLPETQQVDIKAEETQESEEHQRGVTPVTATEPITDTEQPDQIPDEAEKVAQAVADAVEETTVITPESIKIPEITTEPEILTEDAIADVEVMAPEDKVITEAAAEGSEDKVQDQLTLAETEASVVTSLKEAAEDTATVEVTTDSDSTVQAVVEVTEKALDEKEIQTQVQIDLKEVTSVEETEVQAAVVGEEDHGAKTASPESHVPELTKEADLVLEDKTEISSEDKDAKTDSDQKVDDIFELEQQQEEAPKDESATPAEESGVDDQEVVSVGDEVFVLVPKGQAVEMDIEVGQLLEKTSDVEAPTEPEGAGELPIAPESVMEVPDGLQAQNKETITESNLEVKQDVIKEEVKSEPVVREIKPEDVVKDEAKPEMVKEAEKIEESEEQQVVVVKESEKTDVVVIEAEKTEVVEEAEIPEVVGVEKVEKPELVVVKDAEHTEVAGIIDADKPEVVEVKEPEITEVVEEAEIPKVIEEAEKPEVVVVEETETNEIAVVKEAIKTEVVVVEKSEIQDVIEAEKPEVIVKEAEKPEVVVIDKSEIQEITEAERPEVIVKEAEKPEVVVVDEAEKNEIAVVEEAEKTEVVLVKEEEKTEVFVVNESEIQDVIEAEKPEVIVKEAEKPEVVVVDEAEKNEIAVVEEAEKTEVVLVKEEEKTEVFVVNESEIQDVIEAEKPEVIVKEAEKPEVVVVDEAEKNEIAVVEEAEKTEVVVVKEAEKEEFVVVKGAEIQEVIEEEKPEFIVKEEEKPEVVVVKEAEKEEFVVVKDSEQEVILKDREKSDVFAFIEAEKPEIVVVKDLEKQEVVDKESETTDFVETEKTEYVQEEAKLRNEFDNRYSPLAPLEEVGIEEKKLTQEFEEDEGVFSPLRSSTPQLDLSSLHRDDLQRSDIPDTEKNTEQHEDIYKVEDVQERIILTADTSPEINVFREEQAEAVTEVAVEEFEYEMITEQDAKDMPQQEPQKDEEEPKAETVQKREERMEKEVKLEKRKEVFDLFPEEELIEADYEIIDEEEESQARQAAELQGLDWFCFTCGCLLSKDDRASGEHHSHEVTAVGDAFEGIKEKLGDWISELQGRSENIEDLVSELELGYNSVEDQCVECEATMQAQNDEMMALVMEQYNNMSISMEEEKKAKLEQLYDQIVSFQESIDSAKVTLDTTAREAETDARSPEEIQLRLKEALDSAMSLELGPRGLLVFEDYAKGNTSSSHLTQRKGIPVPQRPTLQVQEAGSASSTSVTVYWKVNPGDIIDCFQVYCMEDPQGAVSEEYRVTVKESYCVLEELEPDKTYKVWVMAVNYTGCSLPSERLRFRTAPSVPVINTELCTVMWDSTTLRWSAAKQTPEQTFTVEYCRQYELEGEGLRTISGIQSCEQRVLLQPNENYLFYIKAVNEAGASEQSEAALISTKGTKFRLLKATAHPALKLSADETTIHYAQDTPEKTLSADKWCPFILGELLPCTGQYYWETIVSGSTAYRLGVMSSSANRNSQLGENSASWCLQCIPTPSGCRYQLLHNDVHSSVFVIDMPERVGTLLDYQLGRLCFYNAQTGQLLGAFCQGFTQPCHPALALEMPGRLGISMVPEVPEFTKDS